MTDDPVKVYVLVMAILLAVLGFVAITSYNQAEAFESAIEQAPAMADKMRELAADVNQLSKKLQGTKSKGRLRPLSLIEAAADANGIDRRARAIREEARHPRVTQTVRQAQFKVEIRGRGRNTRPVTREQIARFCRDVERDSNGILKTIELDLKRHVGSVKPEPGSGDSVTNDTYTATIVFGYNYLDVE